MHPLSSLPTPALPDICCSSRHVGRGAARTSPWPKPRVQCCARPLPSNRPDAAVASWTGAPSENARRRVVRRRGHCSAAKPPGSFTAAMSAGNRPPTPPLVSHDAVPSSISWSVRATCRRVRPSFSLVSLCRSICSRRPPECARLSSRLPARPNVSSSSALLSSPSFAACGVGYTS